MNILMVYPEFLVTFWSWKHLLKFVGKKAAFPPLGLLTVAAMLPEWNKKLVDLNVCKLDDKEIEWADYVFVSAMMTQKDSTREVIARCKKLGTPVVLGGPILELGYEEFPDVSHFILGEVENTLAEFADDLMAGTAKKIYPAKNFPDISTSPIPLWSLINTNDYACMLVGFVRGCPFKCAFCNIAALNGRIPRAKSSDQFISELQAIYRTGFRGGVMLTDDNFIGNKKRVREMLPSLIRWQIAHGYPFDFTVEADITIADDSELMNMMRRAGFKKVFLGLETPNKESLIECGKLQNSSRDLAACVKKIQNHGLITLSGFIVGFDNDNPETIFDQHFEFYQKTGIVFPMIGILQAQKCTELFERMQKEGRLQKVATGNNTDCYPNFISKMPVEVLVRGYKELVKKTYYPKAYYERIAVFLREYNTTNMVVRKLSKTGLWAFVRSVWWIGVRGGPITSYYYWKTLLLAFCKYRPAFPEAVANQIYGWHFRKIAKSIKNS